MTKLWITREENMNYCEALKLHNNYPQSCAQEKLFDIGSLNSLSPQIGKDYYYLTTTLLIKKK